MTYLTRGMLTPKSNSSIFDEIFFRDFLADSFFNPLPTLKKINYPVDIYETDNGLVLDIVAVGLDKSDIAIDIKDNILKVSHSKKVDSVDICYAYNGITHKSFDLAWRINEKFDLTKTSANLDKGILKIVVPIAPEKKSKELSIKID